MKICLGTILSYVLAPLVWVLLVVTLGRVDFRHCADCKRRAAALDKLLGNH